MMLVGLGTTGCDSQKSISTSTIISDTTSSEYLTTSSFAEESVPVFVGYVIDFGAKVKEELNQDICVRNNGLVNDLNLQQGIIYANNFSSNYILEEGIDNQMLANTGEKLVLNLRFKNAERDSFVELVLNDSDYGDYQLYSSSSLSNRVISIETFYEDGIWITDVTILMPNTKHDNLRTIEIIEVVFLRDIIDKRLYADLEESESTIISIKLVDYPIETSVVFFEFKENQDGYTVTKLLDDYGIPNIVSIPSYYKGIPVTEIGNFIYLEPESISVFAIPATVTRYNSYFVNVPITQSIYIYSRGMTNNSSYGYEGHSITPSPIIYLYREFLDCDMGKEMVRLNNYDYNFVFHYLD
jgi:hypothetical protein